MDIRISGVDTPGVRPHRDHFEIDENEWDAFTDIEFREVPGIDGGVAAIAWVLHHGYAGALPVKTRLKGLRLRSGNVQVGEHTLLEELFSEPRFTRGRWVKFMWSTDGLFLTVGGTTTNKVSILTIF